jgi:branched-chain amino acid transport system substrate-binding protein
MPDGGATRVVWSRAQRPSSRLYEKLITQDKVDLVLGPYASNVTAAVAQVTERYHYPMIAVGAAASDIWQKGYK